MQEVTEEPASAVTPTPVEERNWPLIRRWAAIGYWLAVAGLVATVGVPTDRGSLLIMILRGLAIPSLGRGWRNYRKALLHWLPFTAVLVVYEVSRGLADGIGLPSTSRMSPPPIG